MTRKIDPYLTLFVALTGLATLIYARAAFFSGSPWVIADDARQFLAWTSRITDPAAMAGNVMVDYWQQTAPPFYRGLLYATPFLNIQPILLSKLLPLGLLPLSAFMAWKLSGDFADSRAARFGGAICIIAAALHTDSIFSGTPRAFSLPLMLMAVHGMASRRHGVAIAGLLMLGLVYPAPAITCLGLFTLHLLQWKPPFRLSLTWGSVAMLGVTAVLVVIPAFLFKSGLDQWGPGLKLSEARQLYSMMLYDGRSAIVGGDGNIAWLCSRRIGFLPAVVNCRGNLDPRLPVNLLLTIVPMLGLWFWKMRRAGDEGAQAVRWNLFPYALLSAIICYLIAAAVAFTLHLPGRYSQPVLFIMGGLALGLLAGMAWDRLASAKRPVRVAMGAILPALMIGAYATPKTTLVRPADPALMAFIAATPPGTEIAGIADDLDFVPAATARGVLATAEHDIPYHRTYHRLNQEGLRASMLMGELDTAVAIASIRRHDVDLLVFDRHFLESGVLPLPYLHTMAPPHRIKPSADRIGALRARSCRIFESEKSVAIFTSCLRSPLTGGA